MVIFSAFKQAVLLSHRFDDGIIEKTFLEMLPMLTENDAREMIGLFQLHRPGIIKNLEAKYCSKKQKPHA